MADDSGVGLGHLQRIVNVHWGGGLAVEFGDKAEDAPGSGLPSGAGT